MEERIFNCYAVIEGDIIREVAIAEFTIGGTDDEKEAYLRENAERGFETAEFFALPENFVLTDLFSDEIQNAIPWIFYRRMLGTAEEILIFEKAFQALDAPLEPMINISVVLDGLVLSGEKAMQYQE